MNFYDTYEAAFESSEGFQILTTTPHWSGCSTCVGKYIINRPLPDGGFPLIAEDAWMVVSED